MAIYQVINQDGQKALVEVPVGNNETWGRYIPGTIPDNPAALIADLPVGAYVTDDKQLPARSTPALYNTEDWITESGTWTAPVTGWYNILAIDGGNGGLAYTSSEIANGGASGAYKEAIVFFNKGQTIQVTIGSGGTGVVSNSTNNPQRRGGVTSVENVDFSKYSTSVEYAPEFSNAFPETSFVRVGTAKTTVYACGAGGGGAYNGTLSPSWYGAGGGATYSSGGTSTASDGYQGAVRFRYYDPNKEGNS